MTDIKERLRKVAGFGGPLITDALARIEELEAALAWEDEGVDRDAKELVDWMWAAFQSPEPLGSYHYGRAANVIYQATAVERERCANKNTIIRALGNSIPLKHLNITALMIVAEDIAAAIGGEDDDD